MYDFLHDLDEYFCAKYANYDKLCVLPGYKMPVMQATRLDEFGRTYAYTLPSETMCLANQEKKAELLATLKTRLVDITFSFSFEPLGFFAAWKNKSSKKGFAKNFKKVLEKYNLTYEQVYEGLSIDEEIWTNIKKGNFLPTKNLVLSIALTAQISFEDADLLLYYLGEQFDYVIPKDVVVSYLLKNKVYNEGMIKSALEEYKIDNLFIR